MLPGKHGDVAIAFPDAVEHRVGLLFAELTHRINVVSLTDESVFWPHSVAGCCSERSFLKGGEGVRCPGLDYLLGDGEVDSICCVVVTVRGELAGDALAHQPCPGLFDMPRDEAWAGGEKAKLNAFVIDPQPWVRDVPSKALG